MGDPKPEVSVIVPTKDEAECVEPLVERLVAALSGVSAEIIFADDSSDHTPSIIEKVSDTAALPVLCVHRPPGERRGGLGGAVVAGLRVASGEFAVVMDGDLQHPPEYVPLLIEALNAQAVDLIVASRYSDGGQAGGLSNQTRRTVSRAVTDLARVMFPRRLRVVSDPMSGFFSFRIAAVEIERLRPIGYKILLEVILRSRRLRVGEIGFDFAPRFGGTSKATFREGLRFLVHIFRLRVATIVRFRRRVGALQVAHA
jgi:dolichol-phosphate mannosyltransferase